MRSNGPDVDLTRIEEALRRIEQRHPGDRVIRYGEPVDDLVMEMVAMARSDVPALIAEIKRLRAEVMRSE